MPKLVKLESNSDVSNYTPPSGNVTAFLAEDNCNIVLKVKKSDGTIAELSGGTGTSDATATAADILSGKTAYVASGKVSGSIPSKAAATYTPGTTNQTIAAGQYLTGAQTVKGDANLTAENIASGVTIFGVTGTHSGGGSGLFDAVKVTAFQEYRAPFTAISKVTLSGFSGDPEMGTDYSSYNDEYPVTPDTMYETDWRKRVYQKTSKVYGSTYYLYYYIYNEDDPPMQYSGNAWVIGTTIGSPYGALWYESDADISAGAMTWQDDQLTSPSCTAAVTTMSEPEQQALFTGVKATAYNGTTKVFTWSGTTTNLTGYDSTPKVHQVYLASGTKLIGDRACSGVTPPEVAFYLDPSQYGMLDVAGGLVGEPSSADMIVDGKYVFNGNSCITFDTSNAGWLNFGEDQDVTIEWFSKTTARTTNYPAEITNGTSWTTNCISPGRYLNGSGSQTYACYWNPNDPFIGGSTAHAINVRRHIAFVRYGTTAYLFVDGVLQGSADCTGKSVDFTLFNILRLGWGSWDGDNGYFIGEIGEVRITRQALYNFNFDPPNVLGTTPVSRFVTVISPQDATSNTGTDYTLSASSIYNSNYEAWKAFNGSSVGGDNGWFSQANNDNAPWLQIEFSAPEVVSGYEFCAAYDSLGQTLSAWTLSGSDGTSWTELHSASGQALNSSNPKFSATFANTTSYRYYRLSFPSTFGYSYIGVQSMKLANIDG